MSDQPRMFLLGVVGEHGDDHAAMWLEAIVAELTLGWVHEGFACLVTPDCLVAPPERGGLHVEVQWVTLMAEAS